MENVELLHNLVKRMDALDVFGHIYEELSTTRAPEYKDARSRGAEEQFLVEVIATSKRGYNDSRVFGAVLHDPTGEGLRKHHASSYAAGNPTALLMLPKIQQAARSRANETMQEYLAWLERNYLGESDAAIANSTGRSVATIRGGRKRAVDFLIEIAHDLRHGGTTYDGDLPESLQRAADLFLDERLADAWDTLQNCRHILSNDPRWMNIAGLVLIAQKDCAGAVKLFKEALIIADDTTMRAKLLNNWGKALHNMDALEDAQAVYLRAWRITPTAAPPLLNLLAVASERHDLQDCRYYANQLTKLLSQGKLPRSQQEIVMNRLLNNPMYDWVRRTDAWKGPSRWLRKLSSRAAAAAALIIGACSLLFVSFSPAPAAADCIPTTTATLQETATDTAEHNNAHAIADKGEGWIKTGSGARDMDVRITGDKGEGWIKTGSGARDTDIKITGDKGEGWIRPGTNARSASVGIAGDKGEGWIRPSN